jgi:hypothetical protein
MVARYVFAERYAFLPNLPIFGRSKPSPPNFNLMSQDEAFQVSIPYGSVGTPQAAIWRSAAADSAGVSASGEGGAANTGAGEGGARCGIR